MRRNKEQMSANVKLVLVLFNVRARACSRTSRTDPFERGRLNKQDNKGFMNKQSACKDKGLSPTCR